MTFDANAIPQELRDRQQWLIWRFEPNPKNPEGKPLKVPYYAGGAKRFGVQGDEKDRAKLVKLDIAVAAMERKGFTGIGFAFLPGDGLIGVDIDKCIDLDTGEISPMADGIIRECLSYTEYSPSRSGVHIIVAGQTETFKSDKIGLEVFCGSQFFTFTGNPFAGLPLVVTPVAPETLSRMRDLVMAARAGARRPAEQRQTEGAPRQRTEFEERARLMSALAAIPPGEYATWIKVGMGLYTTFGESGFAIWDDWSSQSDKYAGPDDLMTHWRSFRNRGVSVTVGSIYGLAKDHRWQPPRSARPERLPPVQKESPPPPEDTNPPPVEEIPPEATGTDDDVEGMPPPPTRTKPNLRVVSSPDLPGGEPPVDTASDEGEGGGAEAAGKGKGKKKVERGQAFWDSVDHLMELFVLLYGTNTAWDGGNRMQIKITDLRYAFGSDPVKFWLSNPDRKMINHDRLVFDPTCQCDEKTHVNLYQGFDVEPKKGDCSKIIDLLSHLCENNQDLLTWILRWIAYPLRHPGAKMTTSVVMHGDEGSGKNLFWEEVVCRLYGKYGGVIGNAQIETQYNEWASQKLFFVCDEVVTRNELKQLKGKLKALVSGKRINVNPKHLPERAEANHMNFVFLSNELQPIALDQSDRRYLVVWTPPKQSLEYYKEAADQAFSGGIEAFYHYLVHELDMGDFNEHTKPLETDAKRDLITLGLDAPERFYREWSQNELPIPFICCSAMQLYWAFQRWCHLNGERFPPTQVLFARKMLRYAGKTVRKRMVEYELGEDVKQRTVYLVGEQPEGKTQTEWVHGASALFDKYLKKYRHVYDQSDLQDEQ